MAYIGNNLDSDIQVNKYEYTATAGQTTFACTYDRAVDVYLNGVKLDSSDFTATNGTAIVLASGANVGDIVDINAYFDVTYANFYTQAEADARFMDINEETLPTQTGQSGKFLTTNGTAASWIDVPPEITKSDTAPSSPANGDFWYDTNDFAFKFYDGTQWQLIKSAFTATGGTITESGGYKYHTFVSSGTFQVTKGSSDIEYLVVAGGGSGGADSGGAQGGGGAGGFISGATTATINSYTISIGAGGASTTSNDTTNSGSNSSAFGSVAIGGGGGGSRGIDNAEDGGSGGGSSSSYSSTANVGSGVTGQGYRGGYGQNSSPGYPAGGGGGASEVGSNYLSNSQSGHGGDGKQWQDGNYYAGGGGGASYSGVSTPGNGGLGGGGTGCSSATPTSLNHGDVNTGGGGGGGFNNNGLSGAGGSGIVIIRYAI